MKHLRILFALLVLLLVSSARAATNDSISINGQVLDAFTHEALDSVRIDVQPKDGVAEVSGSPFFTYDAVKEVKVFHTASADERFAKHHQEEYKAPNTLDVVLKKEYSHGWITNYEIAGTPLAPRAEGTITTPLKVLLIRQYPPLPARGERGGYPAPWSIRLEGFDLLHQLSNTRRVLNAQGITETWTNSLPSYVMLHLTYRWSKQPKKK